MKRVRGNLCQKKNGQFTRCNNNSSTGGKRKGKKRKCKFGVAKAGKRKGQCLKTKRAKR